MKLRITKGRIACAVVLAPVLYVLNIGPMAYCMIRFGIPSSPLFETLYRPVVDVLGKTPLKEAYDDYFDWWCGVQSRPVEAILRACQTVRTTNRT